MCILKLYIEGGIRCDREDSILFSCMCCFPNYEVINWYRSTSKGRFDFFNYVWCQLV